MADFADDFCLAIASIIARDHEAILRTVENNFSPIGSFIANSARAWRQTEKSMHHHQR